MNTTPYTTIEAVFDYLKLEVPSESDPLTEQVEQWIVAMSRYIDAYCNRPIWREGIETFKYDGDDTDLLHITDCIDPSVTVDGREVEVLSYPTNKEYTSRIVLTAGEKFTKGRQNVEVTAVHSMNLYLPDEVQLACTILVAGLYNAREVSDKVGTTERIGSYSVTYRTEEEKRDFASVKNLLSAYRRIAL